MALSRRNMKNYRAKPPALCAAYRVRRLRCRPNCQRVSTGLIKPHARQSWTSSPLPTLRRSIQFAAQGQLGRVTCTHCQHEFGLIDSQLDSHDTSTPRELAHFQLLEAVGSGGSGRYGKPKTRISIEPWRSRFRGRGVCRQGMLKNFLMKPAPLRNCNNPRIVAVHEIGRVGETIYIVSDFIQGRYLPTFSSKDQWAFDSPRLRDRNSRRLVPCPSAWHHPSRSETRQRRYRCRRNASHHGFWFGSSHGSRRYHDDRWQDHGDARLHVSGTSHGRFPFRRCAKRCLLARVMLFEMLTGERPSEGVLACS